MINFFPGAQRRFECLAIALGKNASFMALNGRSVTSAAAAPHA